MRIIYVDGNCNLCNGVIKHIFNKRPNDFRFGRISPLTLPEYVIYIRDGERYNAELAVRMIIKDMSGFYIILSWVLQVVPRGMLRAIYFFISKNRYKVFGRKSMCELSSDIPKKLKVSDFRDY
tara:strand:- start:88 stop:456 length:369 start_codon:yes stop_codon:yes gene_type:complete